MHEFSVSKDMKKNLNNDKRRKEVEVGKVAVHSRRALIIKEFKISVEQEQDRVVITLTVTKHEISHLVVVGTYELYPTRIPLHLSGCVLIHIRIWWASGLHGNSPNKPTFAAPTIQWKK
jgi:hypothetical protein